MRGFRWSGWGYSLAKASGHRRRTKRDFLYFGTVIGLALAPTVQAQPLSNGAIAEPATQLVSFPNSPLPRLVVDCVTIDPAKLRAGAVPSSLDRPSCAALSAPVSVPRDRDLFKVAGAGLAMSVGLTGSDQGFGLLRALASFSHLLNVGPLGGWQFRAEAQLARPPDFEATYLVDEHVRVSLTPPAFGGWSLRFEAGGGTQGSFDPNNAMERGLNLSADLSRGFILPGLGRDEHRLHFRLAEDRTEDRVSGVDAQNTRAILGYSHSLGIGSLGSDLAVIRTQPDGAPAATSMRVEVKFARPF